MKLLYTTTSQAGLPIGELVAIVHLTIDELEALPLPGEIVMEDLGEMPREAAAEIVSELGDFFFAPNV